MVLLSYAAGEAKLRNQHGVPRKEPVYWRCSWEVDHELRVPPPLPLVSSINIAVNQNIRESKEKRDMKKQERITYELTVPVMVKGSKTS
jgi:hypothetical protein